MFAGDDQLRPSSLQTKAEGCLTHFCGCLADPGCEGGELPPRGGRTERGGPLTARGRAVPDCGTPTGERGAAEAARLSALFALLLLPSRTEAAFLSRPHLLAGRSRPEASAAPHGEVPQARGRVEPPKLARFVLSRAALQSAPLLGAGRGRLSRRNAPGAACAFQRCYRMALLPHRAS